MVIKSEQLYYPAGDGIRYLAATIGGPFCGELDPVNAYDEHEGQVHTPWWLIPRIVLPLIVA